MIILVKIIQNFWFVLQIFVWLIRKQTSFRSPKYIFDQYLGVWPSLGKQINYE